MKFKSQIMNALEMERSLRRIALEITEKNNGLENVKLVGIRSRGVPLAERIKNYLSEIEKTKVPLGILDITLYRDDLSQVAENPVHKDTKIDFAVDNSIIVLVDDVLYTGRTVQAALNGIFSLGRPKAVQLCVLIDRGHHEIPVKADFVGRIVPTAKDEIIKVSLNETDEEENVKIFVK
ncbi:MAG: bifunctional pyr operon transcriptional regulator/uracil phosphoribosyltransferase PyrR [Candidatus Cloacimonadota bacterium]|nr:MAG: bifunctional pyr operon transcriptional regulator/uracil phosphoribosyltransferase PyrR [Candidatus Cloacimonadota bacterium]